MGRRPHHTITLLVRYVVHVSNEQMFAYLLFCLESNKRTSSLNLDFVGGFRNGAGGQHTPPRKSQVKIKTTLTGPLCQNCLDPLIILIQRGSYMSAHVLLNLLNELRQKR